MPPVADRAVKGTDNSTENALRPDQHGQVGGKDNLGIAQKTHAWNNPVEER